MKKIIFTTVLAMSILGSIFSLKGNEDLNPTSLYDQNITVLNIDGDTLDWSQFKGKYILFVNVASKCGFTPQYEALEDIYKQYGDKLVVLGLPCNQFGGQEPGSNEEIKSFCSVKFSIDFPMTDKIEVKGDGQHELYKWLTNKDLNGVSSSSVKWNFQKYLINPEGHLIDYWYSVTKPDSDKILKHIK